MSRKLTLTASSFFIAYLLILTSSNTTSALTTTEFGYHPTDGTSGGLLVLNQIVGSQFTCPSNGLAQSISVGMNFTPQFPFGYTNIGTKQNSIVNTIRGSLYKSPDTPTIAQSITARIYCTGNDKHMKAAIYTPSGVLIKASEEKVVSAGITWVTFDFNDPPTLTASTDYVLVVWSDSGFNSGTAGLYATSIAVGKSGRHFSLTYGDWSELSFEQDTYKCSIYCNCISTSPVKAKAAIYLHSPDSSNYIGETEEKTLNTAIDDWVTFNFMDSKPILTADTSYVLVVWKLGFAPVNIWYTTETTDQGHTASGTSWKWPTQTTFSHNDRKFNIYCTLETAYTISPSAGTGGTINPDTPQTINWGGEQTFTITPDTGYTILDITVDGTPINPPSPDQATTPYTYTFTNIQADHAIHATFTPDNLLITPEYPLLGATLAIATSLTAYAAYKKIKNPTK